MQIFIPYPSPLDCAKALWNDRLRYNKQIIECNQILNAIDGAKAWRNHPVCLMYKEHREWLQCYLKVFELYKSLKNSRKDYETQSYYYLELDKYEKCANKITPTFIDGEICIQHRKRLYTKSPELYPQFAEYGTSEENWYYISGQIVKYVNGKRIN